MLSRYYCSPPGGLRQITAASGSCATVGRAVMAAVGMEGGERPCPVLHLAQRCEDDLGGLSLPGCRERERGPSNPITPQWPCLNAHTRTHAHFSCGSKAHTVVRKTPPHLRRPHCGPNPAGRVLAQTSHCTPSLNAFHDGLSSSYMRYDSFIKQADCHCLLKVIIAQVFVNDLDTWCGQISQLAYDWNAPVISVVSREYILLSLVINWPFLQSHQQVDSYNF